MRGFFGIVALSLAGAALTGCGGAGANVEGSVGDVRFDKTPYVYFGGPFVIISMTEVDCEGLDFVRRYYEIGKAPSEDDIAALQFSFTEQDSVSEGVVPVALGASVIASVIKVTGDTFYEAEATAGLLTVESVVDEKSASGVFEGLAFDDGTLDGSFDAVWCRNLKAR